MIWPDFINLFLENLQACHIENKQARLKTSWWSDLEQAGQIEHNLFQLDLSLNKLFVQKSQLK